jgi:hypothetical protein
MNKTQTFTLYLPEDYIEKDDTVIARGLSATEAMKVVFGYEGGWKTNVHETDYGSFTLYVWAATPDKRPSERSFTERLHATVVRTADAERDRAIALDMIAAQCIRCNHLYWDGRVQSDQDFDKRLRRVAQAREVRRIDREIATKLIDALLADAYTITCDLCDREPEFKRSTDRDGILNYMWEVEMVEMWVHKGKKRGWLRLIFDENGWDLVQDYTVNLEHIVDPITEPYLPWNQPNASQLDHGIRVLALNSPDDVLKIEEMLK